jgi:hypothetical protein
VGLVELQVKCVNYPARFEQTKSGTVMALGFGIMLSPGKSELAWYIFQIDCWPRRLRLLTYLPILCFTKGGSGMPLVLRSWSEEPSLGSPCLSWSPKAPKMLSCQFWVWVWVWVWVWPARLGAIRFNPLIPPGPQPWVGEIKSREWESKLSKRTNLSEATMAWIRYPGLADGPVRVRDVC